LEGIQKPLKKKKGSTQKPKIPKKAVPYEDEGSTERGGVQRNHRSLKNTKAEAV
jgi:hypothetical protein